MVDNFNLSSIRFHLWINFWARPRDAWYDIRSRHFGCGRRDFARVCTCRVIKRVFHPIIRIIRKEYYERRKREVGDPRLAPLQLPAVSPESDNNCARVTFGR
ncbi:hypothetical protein P5V15_003972 [Pogonomyrmex californicus]